MKVVLDTNVVVSALLYQGSTARFQDLWRVRALKLVASQPVLDEYVRVLNYPKFKYKPELITGILQEGLLPWLERVEEYQGRIAHRPTDPNDEKFLRVALSTKVEAIVSGDPHLTVLNGKYPFPIVPPHVFLSRFFP